MLRCSLAWQLQVRQECSFQLLSIAIEKQLGLLRRGKPAHAGHLLVLTETTCMPTQTLTQTFHP